MTDLSAFSEADFARMALWHEGQAQVAETRTGQFSPTRADARRLADAHWCAAALIRQHIGREGTSKALH